MNTATESVCPKGWTLPSKTQIDGQRDINSFSPVLGGYYYNGTLNDEATYGIWWGSEAYLGASRYNLRYNGSNLYTSSNGSRYGGRYVRCVSEEKTVTDLTYLQDMTGEIANKRCWIFYLSLANTMIEPKKIFGNFRKLSLASREDSRETRAISVKKFPNIFLARKSSIQEGLIKNHYRLL